jgi:hypothetical protein
VKVIGDLDDPVMTAAAADVLGSALQSPAAATDVAEDVQVISDAAAAADGVPALKQEDGSTPAATATAAKPVRGVARELMQLQEQLQGFKQYSRHGRDKPSAHELREREQQRRRRSRQDLGGRYADLSDDEDDDGDDDDGVIGSGDDADKEDEEAAAGVRRRGGSGSGRQLRQRVTRQQLRQQQEHHEDEDEDDEDAVSLLLFICAAEQELLVAEARCWRGFARSCR